MKRRILLLITLLALVSFSLAQGAPQSTPPATAPHHPMAMDHQKMAEMHKQHMEAMKADLDKMKTSLDQMKANVGNISNADEKARWQSNVDLWTLMVGHMEQMMKHMDNMGPGMGMMEHHHAMKPAPPEEKKPQ